MVEPSGIKKLTSLKRYLNTDTVVVELEARTKEIAELRDLNTDTVVVELCCLSCQALIILDLNTDTVVVDRISAQKRCINNYI